MLLSWYDKKHTVKWLSIFSPKLLQVRTRFCSKFAMMVYVTFAIFIIIARKIMLKRNNHVNQGSVADLVRRGQLKSNRRGMYVIKFIFIKFTNFCLVQICTLTRPLTRINPFRRWILSCDLKNSASVLMISVFFCAKEKTKPSTNLLRTFFHVDGKDYWKLFLTL